MEKYIAHIRKSDGKIQEVDEHLFGTAEKACKFASKFGLGIIGELLGLLHDIGKYSLAFQNYIKSCNDILRCGDIGYNINEIVDHSTAGAQYIYNWSKNKNEKIVKISQIIGMILFSHHVVGLKNFLSSDGIDKYTERMEKSFNISHLTEVLSKITPEIKNRIDEILNILENENDILNKLDSVYYRKDKTIPEVFNEGHFIRMLGSCLIMADQHDSKFFENPYLIKMRNNGDYKSWDILIDRLETHLNKYDSNFNNVNRIRKIVSDCCLTASLCKKGIYTLTVPTGGGKTLSSLRFALHHTKKHGMDRIIYVVPYTSIIDQNADDVRKILEDIISEYKRKNGKHDYSDKIVLEHHSNLTPDEETTIQGVLSQDWDAPIIFTTAVRFLETLFKSGTPNIKRMNQIANSVIIFDEAQTIPIKCIHMFNNFVNSAVEKYNCTVVLCTATQPYLHGVNKELGSLTILPDMEIISDVNYIFENLKRVECIDYRKIGNNKWKLQDVSKFTMKQFDEIDSFLVVTNTKSSARKLYLECKSLNKKNIEIYHLSTNMCPAHRMDILKKIRYCLDEKIPVLCVSTPLIEAGVDVDFNSGIRYLTCFDSIIQTGGRINRNGELKDKNGNLILGKFYIIDYEEDYRKMHYLPDIRIGIETSNKLLDNIKKGAKYYDTDIMSRSNVAEYFKKYYTEQACKMDYKKYSDEYEEDNKRPKLSMDNLVNMLSRNDIARKEYNRNTIVGDNKLYFFQSFEDAGKAFFVIDPFTKEVIIPYKEGKDVIVELCACEDLKLQYELRKKAQRFSINVFQNEFKKLQENGMIKEVQEGFDIYALNPMYYSENVGITNEDSMIMEMLIA